MTNKDTKEAEPLLSEEDTTPKEPLRPALIRAIHAGSSTVSTHWQGLSHCSKDGHILQTGAPTSASECVEWGLT